MSQDLAFAPLPTNPDTLSKLRGYIRAYAPYCQQWSDFRCDQLLAAMRPSTRAAMLEMVRAGVAPQDFWAELSVVAAASRSS